MVMMGGGTPSWLASVVSSFGAVCRDKLAGPGDREAAIRAPLEGLLGAVGAHLGVPAVFHDEVRDTDRQVRPDYGVSVQGAITGYVEVKAPGKPIDPASLTGHDKRQWERQRDLPNLLYTNGTQWRLYRDGEPAGEPVTFDGELEETGAGLAAPPAFEQLVTDFLRWKPAPITSVGALVRAIAPLTRLLRGEVLDQLQLERRAIAAGADKDLQPFTGLAHDWRALLFPQADDARFADGYAQAVTFALLLARTEGIDLEGQSLHSVGAKLGDEHTLMGRALQLLTDAVAKDFKVTLDLLVRVVGAVDWRRVRRGRRDMYLHLYEHFLEQYDNELRKQSGSYYTPREVVEHMVRLTEDALVTRLDRPAGFRDPDVLTVDPAMGTGTYLHTILEHIAEVTEAEDGPGAVAGVLEQMAERLIGFELQMGPYAVAELRLTDLLAAHNASSPPGGLRLYVTDTLDDPYSTETQIGSGLQLIAQSRKRANQVKAKADVTVVIGNPPYKELAVGEGGWVESGSGEYGKQARGILDAFFEKGAGRFKAKLKNLYVYFWRWATWKVWESTTTTPDGDAGIVCFISTSGYLTGPGFTGMRRYLRRYATEGWIIDLTPEGQTPDVPTRVFPGVRQPLAIGLFVRRPGESRDKPATVHVRSVRGRQAEKFAALGKISLDDSGWQIARHEWTAPFTAASATGWDDYPAMDDLMPWYSPGVFPTRRWVVAPSADILRRRWNALRGETDQARKSEMFKEGRDANLSTGRPPLPGFDTHQTTSTPLARDRSTQASPIRIGYRTFDRQWIIPDHRVIDMPRRDLWAARRPSQVFVVEQHSHEIEDGPGLVFSALIPDFHFFNNRGGRTLPLLHPDASPNLTSGLLSALATVFGRKVGAADVLAYAAGVVAHSGYTQTFAEDLKTPGVRVPITKDPEWWAEAVALGEQVIWLHTYGETFSGPGRPPGKVRFPDDHPRRLLALTPITAMPSTITYGARREIMTLGDGEFGPVPPKAWQYTVGGKNVLKSWFNYRKAEPGGKKTSPLDHVHTSRWDPDWTVELLELLTVLVRLVDLEPAQAGVLERVLAGDLLSRDTLAKMGVRWPTDRADRRPHHAMAFAESDDALLDPSPSAGPDPTHAA
jgi:hypothetical protein